MTLNTEIVFDLALDEWSVIYLGEHLDPSKVRVDHRKWTVADKEQWHPISSGSIEVRHFGLKEDAEPVTPEMSDDDFQHLFSAVEQIEIAAASESTDRHINALAYALGVALDLVPGWRSPVSK